MPPFLMYIIWACMRAQQDFTRTLWFLPPLAWHLHGKPETFIFNVASRVDQEIWIRLRRWIFKTSSLKQFSTQTNIHSKIQIQLSVISVWNRWPFAHGVMTFLLMHGTYYKFIIHYCTHTWFHVCFQIKGQQRNIVPFRGVKRKLL